MRYRFRRPGLVPTLAVIAVACAMFSLGCWQLKRLEWKNALLGSIEKAQSLPPVNLSAIAPEDLPRLEWRNVIVTGVLLNDSELYVVPRYYQGQAGYAVLTPLAVGTPVGMEYVLIDRGWVGPQKKDPRTREDGNPRQPVTVEGMLRSHFKKGLFLPESLPEKNLWVWYDVSAMGKRTGLPLLPAVIEAGQTTLADHRPLEGGPAPFPLDVAIRNDHLGYAITWFLIGLSAIAMYALSHIERGPRHS